MRYVVTILTLFINTAVFAQKADANSLKKTVSNFNEALVKRDTVQLKMLLDDKLNYGHSNAWIQTKEDIIADLYNGTLTYTAIHQADGDMLIEGNTALVRGITELDVVMKGKPMQFRLNVMQVWIYKKGWKLFGRQSVKI